MTILPEALTQRTKKGVDLGNRVASRGRRIAGNLYGEARHSTDFAPRDSDRFVAAAYFAADTDSVYQLEQWLWPMEQLADRLRQEGHGDQPFGILSRNIRSARRLREQTDLPVRFSRKSAGLDAFMTSPSLRIVFYVNQALLNFQGLRFPRPAHVHLNHGESEKSSMISNQLKGYDYVFTAGQAARDRISSHLIGIGSERMLDVGRPQLDRPRQIPSVWRDFDSQAPQGPTVFYTPTWEGDSPSMAYGTIAFNGETIVSALLEAGYRVIFRPHPRTGFLETKFAHAVDTVRALIEESPRGFMDTTPNVSWQLETADIALSEMSSVAFEWLSSRKPLVMIAPHHPGAEVLAGGLFDRCPTVEPTKEGEVVELVSSVIDSGGSAEELSDYYLGTTSAGDQVGRFISASQAVIGTRSEQLGS